MPDESSKQASVPEGPVPDRCRFCAHWLGHKSGNDQDQRCNRNWGHASAHGNFLSEEIAGEPFSSPAYVKRDCRVPRWGVPLPPMNEKGEPVGPAPSPEMVDAFIPVESSTVCLQTNGNTYSLHSHQLRQYLMADQSEKEELLEMFDHREEKREAVQQQTKSHYQDKYGTNPKVREGLSELPPWKQSKEKIPTGILQLDAALNGGIEPGTAINVSGNPDAGKSTLSYAIAGAHIRYYRQKVYEHVKSTMLPDGGKDAKPKRKEEVEQIARSRAEEEQIAFLATERFTPSYATKAMNLGPPLFDSELSPREIADQSLALIDDEFIEESTQKVIEAMDVDSKDLDGKRTPGNYSYMLPISYRMMLWDSIDAGRLSEEHFSGNSQEKVRMGDESRVGAQARLLAEFFRKSYKAADVPMTVQMVSQYRANINSYGGGKSPHRGNAHPYYTDLELDVYTVNAETESLAGNLKSVHGRFKKMHVDSNLTEDDEIQLYLRPGQGYDPIDNAIGYCLQTAEKKEDATNGVDCLYRNGSWVYYRPPGEKEEMKMQGTDPQEVYNMIEDAGHSDQLYDQLLEAVTDE